MCVFGGESGWVGWGERGDMMAIFLSSSFAYVHDMWFWCLKNVQDKYAVQTVVALLGPESYLAI